MGLVCRLEVVLPLRVSQSYQHVSRHGTRRFRAVRHIRSHSPYNPDEFLECVLGDALIER
jgi:hypothetical protein